MSRPGDGLPAELSTIEGVVESASMFSERPALWVNGTEIAHRDADGSYDVRLTRAVIRELRPRLAGDPRVRLRKSSGADWVEVRADDASGQAFLFELVALAARAHRAPVGTDPAPPPEGGALARRRRFH